MHSELIALAWTVVLAIVHLFAAAGARNRETGLAYNAGNRDGAGPPVGVVTGRLRRAQANFYESLPLYIAAIVLVQASGVHSELTVGAAYAFPIARAAYLLIYAVGVPYVRTLIWAVGLGSILALVYAALHTA